MSSLSGAGPRHRAPDGRSQPRQCGQAHAGLLQLRTPRRAPFPPAHRYLVLRALNPTGSYSFVRKSRRPREQRNYSKPRLSGVISSHLFGEHPSPLCQPHASTCRSPPLGRSVNGFSGHPLSHTGFPADEHGPTFRGPLVSLARAFPAPFGFWQPGQPRPRGRRPSPDAKNGTKASAECGLRPRSCPRARRPPCAAQPPPSR